MIAAFRTDASTAIGSGHVMRCLTLADALRRRGVDSHFLCRAHPGHLIGSIRARGYPVHRLPPPVQAPAPDEGPRPAHAAWLGTSQQQDAHACIERLGPLQPDWLIVDHYALDARWERALRTVSRRLLAIDDLADRPHECDLLLDQNAFPDPAARYAPHVPAHTRLLLGPRYALLAPAFATLRAPACREAPVERVLVFLGGSDPDNLTLRMLQALEAFPMLQVDVVAGAQHPDAASLRAWCSQRGQARLHPASSHFPALLASADLVLGAGGSTSWERCCLGLPSVVVSMAGNQEPVAQALGRLGAQLYLGPAATLSRHDLGAALATLLKAPALRQSLAERGQALVDGQGAGRVARQLCAAVLTLRPATADDAATAFPWRNAPATRAASFNPQPLTFAGHRAWFLAALADPRRHLLVGEQAGRPVGIARIDLTGQRGAELSLYLDPDRQGEGLGPALIEAACRWLARREEADWLRARVRPDNAASLAAFAQAGFCESERALMRKMAPETTAACPTGAGAPPPRTRQGAQHGD